MISERCVVAEGGGLWGQGGIGGGVGRSCQGKPCAFCDLRGGQWVLKLNGRR